LNANQDSEDKTGEAPGESQLDDKDRIGVALKEKDTGNQMFKN